MPRHSFSAEVKSQAIDLVLHSGLTVASAAQQIGCSVNALQNWLKKHRQQNTDTEPPTFVPLTLSDSKPSSVEIVTPNGFTVRLTQPLSLGELLAAISSC